MFCGDGMFRIMAMFYYKLQVSMENVRINLRQDSEL
jgi:hypothetical protein